MDCIGFDMGCQCRICRDRRISTLDQLPAEQAPKMPAFLLNHEHVCCGVIELCGCRTCRDRKVAVLLAVEG